MFIAFDNHDFQSASLKTIEQANEIIEGYTAQGFCLTLRQLYYQFVIRNLLVNSDQSYKRLGNVISKARLAGLVSWRAIEDRTRNRSGNSHWDDPESIADSCVHSYHRDLWENQDVRLEVWIEKEALAGVIAGVCNDNDVDFLSCRGYMSQSEQFNAGRRFKGYQAQGQNTILIHLGDHDPSGIDMTRDNADRLDLLSSHCGIEVKRIALNYDQVEHYNPPPNPTKLTDSRAAVYMATHGDESWELDALEPKVIVGLIQKEIDNYRDPDRWDAAVEVQEAERGKLEVVRDFLGDGIFDDESVVDRIRDLHADGFFNDEDAE